MNCSDLVEKQVVFVAIELVEIFRHGTNLLVVFGTDSVEKVKDSFDLLFFCTKSDRTQTGRSNIF